MGKLRREHHYTYVWEDEDPVLSHKQKGIHIVLSTSDDVPVVCPATEEESTDFPETEGEDPPSDDDIAGDDSSPPDDDVDGGTGHEGNDPGRMGLFPRAAIVFGRLVAVPQFQFREMLRQGRAAQSGGRENPIRDESQRRLQQQVPLSCGCFEIRQ